MSTPVQATLRALVDEENRDIYVTAALNLLGGCVFTGFFFGAVFALAYLVSFSFFLASSIALLFLGVACWSAWRQVDPLQDLEPLSASDLIVTGGGLGGGSMVFSPRHATAGAAQFLIGGPANLFTAIGAWRNRFQVDDALLTDAADLLAQADPGLDPTTIDHAHPAALLFRLALIKEEPHRKPIRWVLTEKGRRALGGRI